MASRPTPRTVITVVGSLLGLGGLLLVGLGIAGEESGPATANDVPALSATPAGSDTSPSAAGSPSSATPSAKSRTSPSAKAEPKGPAILPESVPTKITIPKIKVSSTFEDLGLTNGNEMASPVDPARVGWFTGAHTPGSPGVGVVAGHVTWNRAPSVFFKLGQLDRNDKITVRREDGSSATFAVQRMSTFRKDQFPTKEVYKFTEQPTLILITCGGTYDQVNHSYDSNVIVWADLVSTSPA